MVAGSCRSLVVTGDQGALNPKPFAILKLREPIDGEVTPGPEVAVYNFYSLISNSSLGAGLEVIGFVKKNPNPFSFFQLTMLFSDIDAGFCDSEFYTLV